MKELEKNILFVTLMLFSHVAMAGTISWNTTANTVDENDIFSLDIIGTDFAEIVDGGGVDLTFDASVLNVLSISFDTSVWNIGTSAGTINNTLGTVDGIAAGAFTSVTDNFIFATIQFQSVGLNGTNSSLGLTEYVGNPWASGGTVITPLNFVNGNVSVVPVPAAVWLFGSGLLGLIGVARKKTRA